MNSATEKGLIAWFMNNHVAANILMLLFIIGGVISVSSMRTETFPSIDPGTINISVTYPGATPSEVASSITSRIEDELIGIDGVKRISSTASEGYGIVSVKLKDFIDSDQIYNDVETAINGLSDFPPTDAERVHIQKARSTPNVLTLAIHGDLPDIAIKQWAESIEDDLRLLPGIALVNLRGVKDYQISIEIPEANLEKYQLSLDEVNTIVTRASQDIPAGTLESNRGNVVLRVKGRRFSGEDFKSIVIKTLSDGSQLTLGNIAVVIDGLSDSNLISRYNGESSAFIDIKRSDSDDTITVANTVKDYIKTASLPEKLTLTIAKDETTVLRERISLMLRNAIIGFLLVFVILLLFLDLRLAFWTSAAIPISFLGGLMIIHFLGLSLNMISLFALIVVLGIVVDDGIVTGESIFEAQEKNRNNPMATLLGVKSVIAPVTVGVLTTMAAFAPLIFSTGQFGQIVGVIPVVVIPILFVSLIEAYFILPTHLSGSHRWSQGVISSVRDRFNRGLHAFIEHCLIPFTRMVMRFRYATIALFITIAIITLAMVQSGVIRFLFMPDIESDQIKISVTMPQGTPFATTQASLAKIEQAINHVKSSIESDEFNNDEPIIEAVSVSIGETAGRDSPGGSTRGETSSRLGEIIIKLSPSDFRVLSASDIESKIRDQIGALPDAETVEFKSSLIGDQADIELELSHSNERTLQAAVAAVKEGLLSIQGTLEVQDNFDKGNSEYIFALTTEGHSLGLDSQNLGRQLRAAYFGLEAERFQRNGSEVVVYVRYPKAERESIDSLKELRIRLNDGREVPLSSVATIEKTQGYSKISSVNGRRIVSITSNVNTRTITPNAAIEELQRNTLDTLQQQFPGINYSFEGESREQSEDLASLGRNMLIALMMIYILLGSQLRSYLQPFVIMTAIPFGVVGAILGHFALGHDLTFISMFGIVALTGVVINDSVVLIDYLNLQKQQGKNTFDSALAAVARRFRPILLTTLSTSLGLLPILLETSIQARFLIPMVVSLAMGILFSTFVILLLIPCLLLVVDDIKRLPSTLMTTRAK